MWPEDETKIICNKEKSLITFEDTKLTEVRKGHNKDVFIELKIPSNLPFETYKVIMKFNVKGKNYGDEIEINVKVVSKLEAFKRFFNLTEDVFSDQDILDALSKYSKWEDAFNYLIKVE